MPRDEATLLDIALACRRIVRFRGLVDRQAFLADEKTVSAVLHQILVIGEAVKRLSQAFQGAHPGVPWRRISGMRDRLIHGYDNVDLNEVWKAVDSDVPALLAYVEPLIPKP
jgi:uncharacterized protein with HEPN domain